MKKTMRLLTGLFFLAVMALPAASAWATTAGSAANTQIINTATLSSNGVQVASSTVTVTVALVPALPTVSIGSNSGVYSGPNTPVLTDSVIITTNANGPASYTIAPTVSASNNATAPSVNGGTSIILGASISTGTSTTTSFTVPCFPYVIDATNNSATQINGIGVNDTIVFTVGLITYTQKVTGVTNPGTAGGTATITFDTVLPGIPPAGTPIYEKQTVNLNVLPGTVIVSGTPIKVDVQAQVTTAVVGSITVDTSTPAASLNTPNIWTTPSPNISVTKYVRNLTVAGNAAGDTPTSFTINTPAPLGSHTPTFYRGGVTANKDDVLEYVIVVTNTAPTAAGDMTNNFIGDVIPTAFSTFFISQYGAVGSDVWYNYDGAESALSASGPQATYVAPNLTVNIGGAAPGNLEHGKTVKIFYQVKVK